MFTGIIEEVGVIKGVTRDRTNLKLLLKTTFLTELQIDQSICHNGVCLTITDIGNQYYEVEAINETLEKTNLGVLRPGDLVNIERCLKVGSRLDGHFVQGHVDTTAKCEAISDQNGSWVFTFSIPPAFKNLVVNKGSICINGVSLTISYLDADHFSVAIIPYTFNHTNFQNLNVGDTVNIEFDILGKYIQRQTALGRDL